MNPTELNGTKPVSESHRFDTGALNSYLQAKLPWFAGPVSVEQFKGGQSNPTYLLITPTRRYVMRTKPGPSALLLPSAHAIEREYRVMAALADTEVPVARMLLLCEDESVIGRAFYLMEYVQGRVFWDQGLANIPRAERGRIYDEMNRVIAALHNVNVARVGLSDYGRPGNFFARQIGRWTKQYQASVSEPIDAMDRLIAWLPEHVPVGALDETQVSLVHGDFRIDNLIFHPSEPRVLAVLDWELSTLGHPLGDFSYHCMSWHLAQEGFRGLAGLDLAERGIPGERDYLRRYCERTGRSDYDELARDWDFYLAYNLFRLAGIVQGIARRAADGTASSEQARATGASARTLADLAWQFAERVKPA